MTNFATAPATLQVRSSSPLRSLFAGIVLLFGLFGVAGAMTPDAHADADNGGNFLGALSSKGITFKSGPAAIAAGRQVCTELDQGKQPGDVANDLMAQSNLDGYHAGYFIGASIGAMCPRHSQ
jgi:hypothetical protein